MIDTIQVGSREAFLALAEKWGAEVRPGAGLSEVLMGIPVVVNPVLPENVVQYGGQFYVIKHRE